MNLTTSPAPNSGFDPLTDDWDSEEVIEPRLTGFFFAEDTGLRKNLRASDRSQSPDDNQGYSLMQLTLQVFPIASVRFGIFKHVRRAWGQGMSWAREAIHCDHVVLADLNWHSDIKGRITSRPKLVIDDPAFLDDAVLPTMVGALQLVRRGYLDHKLSPEQAMLGLAELGFKDVRRIETEARVVFGKP